MVGGGSGSAARLRRTKGASIAEFGPVMFVFFVLILLPLIDLIFFTCGVATVHLVATTAARQAAEAATFTEAKAAAETAAQNLLNSPLAKFASIEPKGGVNGVEFQLVTTAVGGGSSTTRTTPLPPGEVIDTNANLYHYKVIARYGVLPLFNFRNTPFLNDVALLGKPVEISTEQTAMVEHPTGLKN